MRRTWSARVWCGVSLAASLVLARGAMAAARGPETAEAVADYGLAGTVQLEVSGKEPKLGSGFFVSPDGYLLTCEHVVAEAQTVSVKTAQKKVFAGTVVARDAKHDLAVVKVPVRNVPVQVLGDSSALKSGEAVVALGSPLGLEGTVTSGVISTPARKVGDRTLIQTDVPMNPGLSGGPLLNGKGQVVGVIAAMVEKAQDVGFAVPINQAADVLTKAGAAVSVVPTNKDLAYQTSTTAARPAPVIPSATRRAVWPLVVALVVAAGLAAALILLLRKRQLGAEGRDLRIGLRPSGAVRASSTPAPPDEDLDDVDIELR